MSKQDVARAGALIADAQRITVLTGAGISAESGVPTFRGHQGLWRSFRPEELATPEAFRRDPRLVWQWYAWRRSLIAECEPNAAHLALAELGLDRPGAVTLVTQNVDGLHHRAARSVAEASGVSPDAAFPLEVHGAIHRDRCSACALRMDATGVADFQGDAPLPSCPSCGSPMRPDVVWFGESLEAAVIDAAFAAAAASEVCLVVGTSALVHPAASVPEVTRAAGGAVVEVNLDPTPLTPSSTVTILGEAGSILPELLA